MTGQENDKDGLVIKIPTSIFKKHDNLSKDTPKPANDQDFFRLTNIVPIKVKRNSEHGTTEVQSLRFVSPDQHLKIFELLDRIGLYNKLPKLFDYIYQLGCESDGEKRYYAASAVSKLATKLPFLDLKEAIILPWAKNERAEIRNSASMALSELIKHERYKQEVLTLLRHWINIDNPMLNDSALLSFFWIADSHPNETLEVISTILRIGRILHYQMVTEIFGKVYDSSPGISIEQLYKWLLPIRNSDICLIAGLLSAIFLKLDDVAKNEDTYKKVVEMIFELWDNPKMPLHREMQQQTTLMLQRWASEAVEQMNKESFLNTRNYQVLFHELYKKYEYECKRNRLEFYLQKWERARLRELEKKQLADANKKQDNLLAEKNNFSYRHLMPQGIH